MTFVVGLTGGIGSGKSSASKIFIELGIEVIDTDRIAHELTQSGGAAIGPAWSPVGRAGRAPATRAYSPGQLYRQCAGRP